MNTLRRFLSASAGAVCAAAALGQAPAASPTPAAAVVQPAENLVVENVPAIPASLAADVGRYTDFRSAGFSSWHPTRHEMLIGTRFGNVAQAHLVKFPGGARTSRIAFRCGCSRSIRMHSSCTASTWQLPACG